MTDKDLPEAPASVTYSLITPNGFPVLFTLRHTNGSELLDRMDKMEVAIKKAGFKAQERNGYTGKPTGKVEVHTCPIHNVPMKERQGKFGLFYSHFDEAKQGWCNGKEAKP